MSSLFLGHSPDELMLRASSIVIALHLPSSLNASGTPKALAVMFKKFMAAHAITVAPAGYRP